MKPTIVDGYSLSISWSINPTVSHDDAFLVSVQNYNKVSLAIYHTNGGAPK